MKEKLRKENNTNKLIENEGIHQNEAKVKEAIKKFT